MMVAGPPWVPEVPDVQGDGHVFLIGLLGTVLLMVAGSLVYIIRTYTQARQANQAVNNIGPGEHRLYDRVAGIERRLDRVDHELDRNGRDHEHIIALIHRKDLEP